MKIKSSFSIIAAVFVFILVTGMHISKGFCDYNQAFTVVEVEAYNINIQSVASGKVFNVKYTNPLGVRVGDTVTVIIDDEGNWKTTINHGTGNSSAITSVSGL